MLNRSEAAIGRRQHLVGVKNVVWVQGLLQSCHSLDHSAALRVVQECGLLLAYAMLSRDTAVHLTAVVHHEWLNDVLSSLLKAAVFITWENDVQMQVTIANVSVTIR